MTRAPAMAQLLRPTWLEIDLDALAGNVRALRRLIGPRRLLFAVVKANAYGHDATLIAPAALAAGADRLAVAAVNEAVQLREAGVTAPILVLGYAPLWQAETMVHQRLTATVYDLELARAYAEVARRQGKPLTVHVKVDTGMHRLGVPVDEAVSFFRALNELVELHVEGVFTHFSTADEADKSYTRWQLERFTHLLHRLAEEKLRPPLAHAANSAATLSLPESHLDAVRCGIALYGLHPSHETMLPETFRPVLTWKALVAQVKQLPAGAPVSYGNTWTAPRPSTLAVIPVGYADGFPRGPVHWGHVLIHGQPAPIRGRVCMDQTIVDVTDIVAQGRPVRPGDEVVLIGVQEGARLTAEDVAARFDTINYEVTSRILARTPRVGMG